MIIHPEVIVTPDCPTIRFRDAEGKIDLEKELSRILIAQGWGIGTYFNVQFINHDRTKLLKTGLFVVTEDTESLQTNDANPSQPMTKMVNIRKSERIGQWWPQEEKSLDELIDDLESKESEKRRPGRPKKSEAA